MTVSEAKISTFARVQLASGSRQAVVIISVHSDFAVVRPFGNGVPFTILISELLEF